MKAKSYSETSFLAKMLLLFALVFMGHPAKRKGLEKYLSSIFRPDSSIVGQVQGTKIVNTSQLQSALPR